MPKPVRIVSVADDSHFVHLREDEVAYLKKDLEESGRCSRCDHLMTFHFDETGQCWICEDNWTWKDVMFKAGVRENRLDAYLVGKHCLRLYAQDHKELDRRKGEST